MHPLKIAFFCWESLHAVRVGGLAPAATCLAESLARKHEVHYFTRGPGPDEKNGVIYHYCYPKGKNIVDFCNDLSHGALDLFREQDAPAFDVLHFHDWHFVEAMHRLRERNTVMSFHSTEYGRNGNKTGGWWEYGEISGKEWYGAYIARRVVAVSRTLRDEVKALYNVPDWKVDVVQNGIDPDYYRLPVDQGEVKRRYGVHPYAPLVFFGGRLVYQKGPDILVKAMPEVLKNRWDARFLFAGCGDMQDYLSRKTRGTPARLLGYVEEPEFIRLLNAADIVAIPSRNEPFGLILTEAWSAGRCVVASDVGGLSENIDHFVNGVKVPVSSRGVAGGINAVIDDRGLCCSLGQKGQEKVEREFRWEQIAHRMERAYNQVL
ncbi:glycosyltransferase family 4 protein [Methanofollis fontis]|uniref:Glycosyltransferase family 1 protein n=1 Tax=Methanofollis fontis TaxID=2052832 RepID=A0A483CVP1_9EURY|nr:glycosyltransferase family 4 protein [Methanofollis fontis]TAJ45746.1 glycosyltransferase family 1 protein [Methanofollis fontis]